MPSGRCVIRVVDGPFRRGNLRCLPVQIEGVRRRAAVVGDCPSSPERIERVCHCQARGGRARREPLLRLDVAEAVVPERVLLSFEIGLADEFPSFSLPAICTVSSTTPTLLTAAGRRGSLTIRLPVRLVPRAEANPDFAGGRFITVAYFASIFQSSKYHTPSSHGYRSHGTSPGANPGRPIYNP